MEIPSENVYLKSELSTSIAKWEHDKFNSSDV